MQPDFSQIAPFLFAALVIFAIYRRFRRNFGRQPLRPARMRVRMVLLTVLVCLLLPAALRSTQFLAAQIAGAALGIGLAVWGAQRTRFLTHGGQLYYVPHAYAGIVVSLLFLGRLVYRIAQIYGGARASAAAGAVVTNAYASGDPAQAFAPASMLKSPLTVGIFFLLAGYYLYYYGWVLWKSKHLEAADTEADSAASSDSAARPRNLGGLSK